MNTYHHVQKAGATLVVPAAAGALLLALAAAFRTPAPLPGVLVVAGVAWMFRSLTVEVADGELRWHFGSGLLRRRVRIDALESWQAVRTTWLDGWGIHFTAHGWLHNVAGRDAVAVRCRDGRRMAVGTDDPEGLVAALAGVRA